MDRPGVPAGDAGKEGPLTGEGIRTGSYKMSPDTETFWCASNPSYSESLDGPGDDDTTTGQ